MNPAWSFLARLESRVARLSEARQAIQMQVQDTRLKKRLGDELSDRIEKHIEALRTRKRNFANSDSVPEHAWGEVAPFASSSLLDESLLYLQAARSRSSGSEADLCEITDALFREIADQARSLSWNSFCVFAVEDSFDVLTQVIRVRYPLSGVWDIPVAVHEFGHFFSSQLRGHRADGSSFLAFEEYKSSSIDPRRMWLDEIFADLFATYTVGPAFACSCLLLRFDPVRAQEEADGKHPSYAKRASVILRTLSLRNNENPGSGSLRPLINILDNSWRETCTSAGTTCDVSPEDQAWINLQISNIYNMLKSEEEGLRFKQWESASNQVPLLEEPAKSPADFAIIELLNAAWISRLKANSRPDQLSQNFTALARRKTVFHD